MILSKSRNAVLMEFWPALARLAGSILFYWILLTRDLLKQVWARE